MGADGGVPSEEVDKHGLPAAAGPRGPPLEVSLSLGERRTAPSTKKRDETWTGRGKKGTGWKRKGEEAVAVVEGESAENFAGVGKTGKSRKGSDDRTCRSCTFKDTKPGWITGRCDLCKGPMCSRCTEKAEDYYDSMCSECVEKLDAAHDQDGAAAVVRLRKLSRCRVCGCARAPVTDSFVPDRGLADVFG